MQKVTAFIGSSREGLSVAQAIQLELQHEAVCTIWYQGVFGLMRGTLEELVAAGSDYEFAIFVLTPDDVAVVREETVNLPRDNVLFELGLFMGRLGRKRVFVVVDDSAKRPSDFGGVTLASFSGPHDRELAQYSPQDLLPHIGPAVQKIRSAIHKVQKERPLETTWHYIPPMRSPNEYLAELQVSLETEQYDVENTLWSFHPPVGDQPSDTYVKLRGVLKTARAQDVVILHPRGMTNARLKKQLEEALREYPRNRIVFLDQQPPPHLLDADRCSYIGVANRQVGIVAAFALYDKLGHDEKAVYYVLSGPGGLARSQGFVDGVAFLTHDKKVRTFQVEDASREHNKVTARQIVETCSQTPVGIFAGNDETALVVLEGIEELSKEQVFVVGCDATKEMRSAIDRRIRSALATIDIRQEGVAKALRQAVEKHVVEFFEPKLYPVNANFEQLKTDSKFQEFWEKHD